MLRAGSCVSANCEGSSSVIPGLGVCLSELVEVPKPSGTNPAPPLPSITGLADPTTVDGGKRPPLEWWQILLMALGCAFIFLVVLMCWRRRARKQRAKRTAMFASAKNLGDRSGWRWRLVRFGERLFGHKASRSADVGRRGHEDDMKLTQLRDAEEARHTLDVEHFIDAYDYSTKSRSSKVPSALPSLGGGGGGDRRARDLRVESNRMSKNSLFSELTGTPRQTAEPRQPVKDLMASRFSISTIGSSKFPPPPRVPEGELIPVPPLPTEAQVYANAIKPGLAAVAPTRGAYWLEPTHTGSSSSSSSSQQAGLSSRNPFRQQGFGS